MFGYCTCRNASVHYQLLEPHTRDGNQGRVNVPITGDIPKVGEGSKFAAEMWLEDIKRPADWRSGERNTRLSWSFEDNESKAESAVKANTKMITEDEVIAIVGPQSSSQAVPAGDVANNYKTPMISPWSTNPNTTKDRPYVFRGCFLDPFQGPVVANLSRKNSVSRRPQCCSTWPATTQRDWPKCSRKAWEKHQRSRIGGGL
jgi:branched-chain amino acid transport system substrate-binding protein